MPATLSERYTRLRIGNSMRDARPLEFFHFAVPRLREAFGAFASDSPPEELHLRGPNKGTKTLSVATWVTACLAKLPSLDGVPLPQWRGKVEAAQLVLDYKQHLLSVMPAYLKAIGQRPHHARYTGEVLSSLRVQPEGGTSDESTWSVVHFLSQENKRSGVGARADIVAFDEPPVIEILRELRKAGHSGRKGIRIIGETPTLRRQWAPLREDYGETPRKSIRRVDLERLEVRWSLDEVADWVLSPTEKASLWRKYQTDRLRDARWHGDYISDEGSCPFHVPTLEAMLAQCVDPEIVPWKITREVNKDGQPSKRHLALQVEVWDQPKVGSSYYIPIDPASGTDDNAHDPLELQVLEMGTGDLVARFGGYVPPHVMGVLAAGLARQYNNAVVQPEVNDGWAVGVLQGLADSRYGNIGYEMRELKPGHQERELGFRTTAKTRPAMVSAIQSWIEAWQAGAPYGRCRSAKVINCLLDVVLDENGKPVAAPGYHDEAMIVWGQGLRHARPRGGARIPEIQTPDRTPDSVLVSRILGVHQPAPAISTVLPRPKLRPSV